MLYFTCVCMCFICIAGDRQACRAVKCVKSVGLSWCMASVVCRRVVSGRAPLCRPFGHFAVIVVGSSWCV